jgi:hypothetical protein
LPRIADNIYALEGALIDIFRLLVSVFSELAPAMDTVPFSFLIPQDVAVPILSTFFHSPLPASAVLSDSSADFLMTVPLDQFLRTGRGGVTWPSALPMHSRTEQFSILTYPQDLESVHIAGTYFTLISCRSAAMLAPFTLMMVAAWVPRTSQTTSHS